jgi:hypothetical protein
LVNRSRGSDAKPVKIAILDTGIDTKNEYINLKFQLNTGKEPRHQNYQDFVHGKHSLPQDSEGHGTHIAGIILRYAPMAKIYVARIAETHKSSQNDKSLNEKVAKVCRVLW